MRNTVFWLLWALVFTIPWENMIAFAGFGLSDTGRGGTLSKAIGLTAAAAGVLAVIVTGRIKRIVGLHYAMFLFVAWACLSLAWSNFPGATIVKITTYIQLAGLAWLIWEFAVTRRQQSLLMHAYIWGGAVGIASQMVSFLSGALASRIGLMRVTGGGLNLNEFAVAIATTIPMAAFYVTGKGNSTLLRVSYAVYCTMAGFSVLLTGSRTGLVVLLVGVGFTVLAHLRVRPLYVVVLVMLTIAVAIVAPAYLPEQTTERFAETPEELRTGTWTHRLEILEGGLKIFARNALYGTGSGTFNDVISEELSGILRRASAHNVYLSVLVELGIVGLTLFLAMFVLAAIYAWKTPGRERFLWLVTLAVWMIGALALNMEDRKPMWFLLGLLAAQYAALSAQPLARRVLVRKSRPAGGKLAREGGP